jgi:alkanesulfonate monooxygenase SsuD/methylene tetrahydromethanopterin reductase-like flavin-dependent oxidoreductase (luciferase family)
VIDSEWKWHYLLPYEARELVSYSRNITTVLTFSSRHHDSLRLLSQTLNAIGEEGRLGLNLVVGNPAYLSLSEFRRPAVKTLIDSVRFVRRHFQNLKVFIGTEGLIDVAAKLAAEYNLTPFLLLDKTLEDDVATVRDSVGKGDVAIYVPFLISSNYPRLLHDILFRMSGYILRRRWVREKLKDLGYDPALPALKAVIQEKKPLPPSLTASDLGAFLKSAASTLTVYGDEEAVIERIKNFRKLGLNIVVGLPIKENEKQILSFGTCVKKSM